jgi:hypothetical protein
MKRHRIPTRIRTNVENHDSKFETYRARVRSFEVPSSDPTFVEDSQLTLKTPGGATNGGSRSFRLASTVAVEPVTWFELLRVSLTAYESSEHQIES